MEACSPAPSSLRAGRGAPGALVGFGEKVRGTLEVIEKGQEKGWGGAVTDSGFRRLALTRQDRCPCEFFLPKFSAKSLDHRYS